MGSAPQFSEWRHSARFEGCAHVVRAHGDVVGVQLHAEHVGHVAFDLFGPATRYYDFVLTHFIPPYILGILSKKPPGSWIAPGRVCIYFRPVKF